MMDTRRRKRCDQQMTVPMGRGHITATRLHHHIHPLPLLLTQIFLTPASANAPISRDFNQ